MNIADKVKADFEAAILAAFEDWERDFYEPTTLFSRNRKLDKVTMVKLLCLMGGNSLRKELYKLRWREEIFFRHIKYDCGAGRMKCKEEDYSRQELHGHFITSAAVWKITNGIVLEQKPDNAYEYKTISKWRPIW